MDADEHHQRLALDGLVVPFVADDPAQAADVVFGARALGAVEGRFTAHLLDWLAAGRHIAAPPARPARRHSRRVTPGNDVTPPPPVAPATRPSALAPVPRSPDSRQ